MLKINVPYSGDNTQENTASSAGRQSSLCESRVRFRERAVAQLGHLWNVDCISFCWFQVSLPTVATTGSKCFLSCLLTHKSRQSQGPGLHAHTVFPHVPAFQSVLAQCSVVSHWRRLQMCPRTPVFTTVASLLLLKNHTFCGFWLKKAWIERGLNLFLFFKNRPFFFSLSSIHPDELNRIRTRCSFIFFTPQCSVTPLLHCGLWAQG